MNQHLRSIPNFSKDPRRLKKAQAALDLCYSLDLSPSGCKPLTAGEVRKVLGNQSNSNSELAAYLHTLVRQVGSYSKADGRTYSYQTVPHRVARLEAILNQEGGLRQYAEAQGKSFRVAPDRSDYKLTGDRHYAWWTNMRKEVRQKLFVETHGVLFDYDIEAAKPTVTLQAWRAWMAIHHPVPLKHSTACQLPTWTQLVYNRKVFRSSLARDVGITEQQAKSVCQNVLNSAIASPHPDNGICQVIGTEATKRLMANPLYLGLREDFKTMWKYFKVLADGKTAGEFMSSFYNKQERAVMDAVAELLEADAWFVHDGFMTHEEVDVNFLEAEVREKTGLCVKFEMNIFRGTEDEAMGEEVHEEDFSPATPPAEAAHAPYNVVHKFRNTRKNFNVEAFIALDASPQVPSVVHKLNKRRWSGKLLHAH